MTSDVTPDDIDAAKTFVVDHFIGFGDLAKPWPNDEVRETFARLFCSLTIRHGVRSADAAEILGIAYRASALPNRDECPRCHRSLRFREERENRLCAVCVKDVGLCAVWEYGGHP